MKLKRFREYLKERFDTSYGPKIYKSSYTTMLDVIDKFDVKQARFIIDHKDKLRFGHPDELIHLQLAIEDPTMAWMRMSPAEMDRQFASNAKYAGYITLRHKTFSIAKIAYGGGGYGQTRPKELEGKIKLIIDMLEKKGFRRLEDGDWPR